MPSTTILLAAYVLGTALACGAIVAVLRVGRGRVTSPTCAGCGYDLTGRIESAAACPECGRALAGAGITREGRRRPLSTVRKVLLLTIVVAGVGLALTPPVEHLMARRSVIMQTTTWSAPSSGAYRQVTVTGSVTSMRRRLPVAASGAVSIIDHDGIMHSLAFDRGRGAARFVDLDGRPHERPVGEAGNRTGAVILEWMTELGLIADRTKLRVEADALAAYLHKPDNFLRLLPGEGLVPESIADTWPAMPYGHNSKTVSQVAAPPPWRVPLLVAPWIVLWALGSLGLVIAARWRSRRAR
ncbi:MAG: hypothetical protein ACYTJ0_12915 [Planctomycetota bacterium]|jgi:predicted RNA-binding Zn-ribbon protein involved in translation (DUF1610 family)